MYRLASLKGDSHLKGTRRPKTRNRKMLCKKPGNFTENHENVFDQNHENVKSSKFEVQSSQICDLDLSRTWNRMITHSGPGVKSSLSLLGLNRLSRSSRSNYWFSLSLISLTMSRLFSWRLFQCMVRGIMTLKVKRFICSCLTPIVVTNLFTAVLHWVSMLFASLCSALRSLSLRAANHVSLDFTFFSSAQSLVSCLYRCLTYQRQANRGSNTLRPSQ